jgi:hypothetical protein
MATSLGFLILKVQTEFPDCEALRMAGKDRNRPVKIEFEYESRNFLRHMHDPAKCDINCLLGAQLAGVSAGSDRAEENG